MKSDNLIDRLTAAELEVANLKAILKRKDMEIHSLNYDLNNLKEAQAAVDAGRVQHVVLQTRDHYGAPSAGGSRHRTEDLVDYI